MPMAIPGILHVLSALGTAIFGAQAGMDIYQRVTAKKPKAQNNPDQYEELENLVRSRMQASGEYGK